MKYINKLDIFSDAQIYVDKNSIHTEIVFVLSKKQLIEQIRFFLYLVAELKKF